MKVNQTGSNPVTSHERIAQADESTHQKRSEKSTNDHATSHISLKSKEFSKAKASALRAPDVREERVHELKQRIAKGTYEVSPERVADRLVDEHLQMKDLS